MKRHPEGTRLFGGREKEMETNKNLRIEQSCEYGQDYIFYLIRLIIPIIATIIQKYLTRRKSRRLANLYGEVTNKLTGAPVEGILITCKGPEGLYAAITSADGSYRLENLPPGSYTVIAADPQGRYVEAKD